jgi:hypothetical protein
MSTAPKKKNNKKKKGGKGKSNGNIAKEQDVEKDTTPENGDGDGDVEDSEQSGVVRVTPVHLTNARETRKGRALTASIEYPKRCAIPRYVETTDERS